MLLNTSTRGTPGRLRHDGVCGALPVVHEGVEESGNGKIQASAVKKAQSVSFGGVEAIRPLHNPRMVIRARIGISDVLKPFVSYASAGELLSRQGIWATTISEGTREKSMH